MSGSIVLTSNSSVTAGGTLWRLALALACAHLLALMMLGIDFIIHMMQAGESNLVNGFKLFIKLLVRMVTNSDQ